MARLSGSVSDAWLSPVRSSSAATAAYSPRRCCKVAIFSARFLASDIPADGLAS